MKTESQRQKRVATQVKEIVAEAFYTTNLGSVCPVRVTVSDVRVSKDLKLAYIYFMVFEGAEPEMQRELEKILNMQAKEVNTYIAKQLTTKYTPKVRFMYDAAYEAANKIDVLIQQSQ